MARLARCSRSVIGRIERGGAGGVTPRRLEAVAGVLGARLIVRLDWNGEALDRLLDAGHAALVEAVVATLGSGPWEVIPEATFAIDGERGSTDILAWSPGSAVLLVVEVKSVVPDVQAMLASLDRKLRLATRIGSAHGWRPAAVAGLLVIGDTRTSRRRIEHHRSTFASRFPDRIATIRRFVRDPASKPSLRGLWFLPSAHTPTARHRVRPMSSGTREGKRADRGGSVSTGPGANA